MIDLSQINVETQDSAALGLMDVFFQACFETKQCEETYW